MFHDEEFTAPRAQVWQVLLPADQDIGMQLESADSAAGAVVFRLQTSSPRVAGTHASVYLDCGRGPGGAPRVDTYQLSLRLTMAVESIDARKTLVRTGLVAYARDRSTTADQIPCTSTGRLEQRALSIISARLAQ